MLECTTRAPAPDHRSTLWAHNTLYNNTNKNRHAAGLCNGLSLRFMALRLYNSSLVAPGCNTILQTTDMYLMQLSVTRDRQYFRLHGHFIFASAFQRVLPNSM